MILPAERYLAAYGDTIPANEQGVVSEDQPTPQSDSHNKPQRSSAPGKALTNINNFRTQWRKNPFCGHCCVRRHHLSECRKEATPSHACIAQAKSRKLVREGPTVGPNHSSAKKYS